MNVTTALYNSRDAAVMDTPSASLTTPLLKGAGGMAIEQRTPTETWKRIPGFPNYEVSDLGRVRSLRHTYVRVRAGKECLVPAGGQVLNGWVSQCSGGGSKYLRVGLSSDGVRCVERVHRLVLLAFVGPCPEGMEACHNDGNSLNNSVGNLRWDTRQSNMNDLARHGRKVNPTPRYGKNNHMTRLSENDVAMIRSAPYVRGMYARLARDFKCSIVMAWNIRHNKRRVIPGENDPSAKLARGRGEVVMGSLSGADNTKVP